MDRREAEYRAHAEPDHACRHKAEPHDVAGRVKAREFGAKRRSTPNLASEAMVNGRAVMGASAAALLSENLLATARHSVSAPSCRTCAPSIGGRPRSSAISVWYVLCGTVAASGQTTACTWAATQDVFLQRPAQPLSARPQRGVTGIETPNRPGMYEALLH
jgi:hypothetical protein